MSLQPDSGIKYYGALAVSALLLLIPAFWNHFPLVNPDVATYLTSGFKPETPFDRPITYGLLIRLFSINGLSMWSVVFMQGYIVSWLVFKIIEGVTGNRNVIHGILTILFLVTCTPLSWLVSQVQPDISTSVACMCIVLVVLNNETKSGRVLLYVLFFVSVGVHMSHPLLFVSLLFVLLLFKRLFVAADGSRSVIKNIVILLILSVSAIGVMGSALSKSRHVFFVGSLLEKGVLKEYLNDKCAIKGYRLCAYKDALPLKSDDFIWDNNSPLYKVGDWSGSKKEFNEITSDVLTSPKYLWLFARATASQSCRQAVTFHVGDGNTPFHEGSNVYNFVGAYFPGELKEFAGSRQNTSYIESRLPLPNFVFDLIVCISLTLLLIIIIVSRRDIRSPFRTLLLVSFAGIIINCADCAAFSVLTGRYGYKMIWLIPFCAAVYLPVLIKQWRTAT